jgi:hypothetical protein
MRVVKILFFFLLIGLGQLKAQTNFVKGYYITPAQDTVRGYLEYRSENRNFDNCVFKQDLNSAPVTFLPKDINGFAFEDKDFYEKHTFKNRKGEESDGFFKVILRGDISLLRYRSKHFVKTQKDEIIEISRNEQIVDSKLVKDYVGMGALHTVMKDCAQAAGEIFKTKPDSEGEFRAIFEQYYQCKGKSPFRTEDVMIRRHADFGVLGSVAMMQLQLDGPFKDVNVSSVTTFSAGAYASFFIPRVDEKFRLVVEATYTKYKNYQYFSTDNVTNTTNNDLYINYSALRVPLLARYSTKVLFFDLGIQNQLIVQSDPRWRVETVWSDAIFTTDNVANVVPTFTLGYLVGIGAKCNVAHRAVRSSVRFSKLNSFTADNLASNQTIELMLAIQINR